MTPLRILVVDDHALIRRAVKGLLELEPRLEVIGEAASGLEAISTAEATHPDVLILDWAMPDLSGFEVAKKALAIHPGVEIVLLTANLTPELRQEALAVGIGRCLSKSESPDQLIAVLRSILEKRVAPPSVAEPEFGAGTPDFHGCPPQRIAVEEPIENRPAKMNSSENPVSGSVPTQMS